MNTEQVTVVRIYLTEEAAHLKTLLKRLNDWGKVKGVTVFQGVAGFGDSGTMHAIMRLDSKTDENLPVVVEFFDEPAKCQELMGYLSNTVKPGHMLHWNVNLVVDS